MNTDTNIFVENIQHIIKSLYGTEPIINCALWFVNSQSNKERRFGPEKQTLLLFLPRLWTRLRQAAGIPRSAVRWPASVPRICFWTSPQKSTSRSLCFLPADQEKVNKPHRKIKEIKWRWSSRENTLVIIILIYSSSCSSKTGLVFILPQELE